jgi:hypothetical protein
MRLRHEKGVSLVELLVAAALLGLVLTAGFALFEVPEQMRKSFSEQAKKDEIHRQSFDLFYRAWNERSNVRTILGASLGASDASGVAIRNVAIRFSESGSGLVVSLPDEAYITVPGGSGQLNDLLSYRAFDVSYEEQSFCRFTTPVAGEEGRWLFQCPGGLDSRKPGIAELFQNTPVTELPVVMIDGRICYVLGHSNSGPASLLVDTTRNDCLTPTPLGTDEDHRGMFSLPLLVVFSQDGSFSQAIFDSFHQPRERFGNSGLNYPRKD